MPRAHYEVVRVERKYIMIRDLNDGAMSVTNDAERVIQDLRKADLLSPGRRLFYVDTDGQLDEILITADGRFAGFEFAR